MNNQEMMELSTVDKSDFEELVKECTASGIIDQNLYTEYDVKRGLRDSNGNGVLTGLTEISDVLGNQSVHGRKIPVDGELYFQGYNVEEIIKRSSLDRFRFEEATYLLLFGVLPDKDQLDRFIRILTDLQELSGAFIRDVIMKATSTNLMNSLMKSILSLYSYDEKPDDISIPNVLRQSLQLIAKMPLLSVYAYQSYRHFKLDGTLMIKNPKKGYSTAENILYMLRDDGDFTELEAKVLDICLVLHAEHGGGNNSTFTTHVVTSSGTDTYSAIASSIASLKGPKHGGANLRFRKCLQILRHIAAIGTIKMRYVHILTRSLTKKHLTMPDLSMVWVMRYILIQILEQLFLRNLQNSFQKRRECRKNLHYMSLLKARQDSLS